MLSLNTSLNNLSSPSMTLQHLLIVTSDILQIVDICFFVIFHYISVVPNHPYLDE